MKKVKEQITQAEFQKKVEIESSYLTYIDRLPKEVADKKAKETVSEKYEVVNI
jgi:hypothetical protein